jgi:hypothetical protein
MEKQSLDWSEFLLFYLSTGSTAMRLRLCCCCCCCEELLATQQQYRVNVTVTFDYYVFDILAR